MRKVWQRFVMAMAVAIAIIAAVFVSVAPAQAELSPVPGACPVSSPTLVSWSSFPWHTTSWGRAKTCQYRDGSYNGMEFLTEDTLTDGYCVHIDVFDGIWEGTDSITVDGGSSSQSCGTQVGSWTYDSYPGDITSVRLIRGTGTPGIGVNYSTIWTHP